MAEKASLQTERELVALRRSLELDLSTLTRNAKADLDPRRWIRRSPVAAAGTLGSIGALILGTLARRGRPKKQRRGENAPAVRDRLTDVALTAAGGVVTTIAARAARRFAARLFGDEGRP